VRLAPWSVFPDGTYDAVFALLVRARPLGGGALIGRVAPSSPPQKKTPTPSSTEAAQTKAEPRRAQEQTWTHAQRRGTIPLRRFHVLLSLSSQSAFSPFVHTTCSLSVFDACLVLDRVYDPIGSAVPSKSTRFNARAAGGALSFQGAGPTRGFHSLWRCVPGRLDGLRGSCACAAVGTTTTAHAQVPRGPLASADYNFPRAPRRPQGAASRTETRGNFQRGL